MDPLMKLLPIINAIGNSTVFSINKFTLVLLVLFCIPIINIKNKDELNKNIKNIFLNVINISLIRISVILNYI